MQKGNKNYWPTVNGRDLAQEWNNLREEQKTEFRKTGKIEAYEIEEEEWRKKKEEKKVKKKGERKMKKKKKKGKN